MLRDPPKSNPNPLLSPKNSPLRRHPRLLRRIPPLHFPPHLLPPPRRPRGNDRWGPIPGPDAERLLRHFLCAAHALLSRRDASSGYVIAMCYYESRLERAVLVSCDVERVLEALYKMKEHINTKPHRNLDRSAALGLDGLRPHFLHPPRPAGPEDGADRTRRQTARGRPLLYSRGARDSLRSCRRRLGHPRPVCGRGAGGRRGSVPGGTRSTGPSTRVDVQVKGMSFVLG